MTGWNVGAEVKIAGSIRRHEKNPIDIDIVCIPKDKKKLENFLSSKGKKFKEDCMKQLLILKE